MDDPSLRDALRTVFNKADADGSGSVSTAELRSLLDELEMEMSDEALREMIREADPDRSGTISFEELLCATQKQVAQGHATGLANVVAKTGGMMGLFGNLFETLGSPFKALSEAVAASPLTQAMLRPEATPVASNESHKSAQLTEPTAAARAAATAIEAEATEAALASNAMSRDASPSGRIPTYSPLRRMAPLPPEARSRSPSRSPSKDSSPQLHATTGGGPGSPPPVSFTDGNQAQRFFAAPVTVQTQVTAAIPTSQASSPQPGRPKSSPAPSRFASMMPSSSRGGGVVGGTPRSKPSGGAGTPRLYAAWLNSKTSLAVARAAPPSKPATAAAVSSGGTGLSAAVGRPAVPMGRDKAGVSSVPELIDNVPRPTFASMPAATRSLTASSLGRAKVYDTRFNTTHTHAYGTLGANSLEGKVSSAEVGSANGRAEGGMNNYGNHIVRV